MLFLLDDVPADVALAAATAMGGAIVSLAAYVRVLHAQNRADLQLSLESHNKVANSLDRMARAIDERTRRIAKD